MRWLTELIKYGTLTRENLTFFGRGFFVENETEVYLVGGAVRDELLRRSCSDKDYVVIGASPKILLDKGFTQIGKDFPCFLHPETKDEYALARIEKKTGMGHNGFECDSSPSVSLEDDLSRRDLTMNAIAKDLEGGYIDPYGGISDIENRIIKHVSSSFSEDPLRVLRVARFAARYHPMGFTVHSDTMALMTSMVESGELSSLTPERVWKEVHKALSSENPSIFFYVLRECGALKVILPELDLLSGIPQPPKHHPEIDTFTHTMLSIDKARNLFDSDCVTFATLLHDLGKALSPKEDLPKHIGHEKAGEPLVRAVCLRLRVPKRYMNLACSVAAEHLHCHKMGVMGHKSILKLLKRLDAYRNPDKLLEFTQACESDARGRLGLENERYYGGAMLLGCREASYSIDTKSIASMGYSKDRLLQEIKHSRAIAVKEVIRNWREG